MRTRSSVSLWSAAVLACAPLPAQLLPGTPHAFEVSTQAPQSITLDRVMPGEFDGDHRGDLALLVGGELRLVRAAAGYGVPWTEVAPGGGTFRDLAVVPAVDPGRDRLFALVRGGTADGLYELSFANPASPSLRIVDAEGFESADALAAHATVDTHRVFGIVRGEGLVHRVLVAGDTPTLEPAIPVPAGAKRFQAASLEGDKTVPQLTLELPGRLDIFDLSGAQTGSVSLQPSDSLVDFATGFNAAVGAGRIIQIVSLASGLSECRVSELDGTLVQWIDFGVTAPRIALDDLIDRGELDIVAVTTSDPLGFASFAGLGAAPGTYNFTPIGTVLFGFPSPNFGTATAHSNLAVFDLDYDGDRDVAFCDPSTNTVWVQPSWITDEINAAPVVADVESLYTYQRPNAQDFAFAFTRPLGSFVPTHLELNIYQKKVIEGTTHHLHVCNAFVPAVASTLIPGAYETGTVTVIAEYDGAQGTDADFVTAVRFLAAAPAGTSWQSIGVEGYAEFHHTRTPHPHYPGYYISGSPGGVNPLPVVIGSGVVAPGTLPPAPPPPPGT
ncbi:MAG: hypothetical protein AB7I19_09995 [Planctomycetota bacterium]